MKVLAIETSCDETAAAILERSFDCESLSSTLRDEHRSDSNESSSKTGKIKVLANIVSSQVALHEKFGGVVPNLAARNHTENIGPVVGQALVSARLEPEDIDLLAVTQGPGLIPALLVGTTAAKTLALLWQKPLLGIHHLEGHIYANFIGENQRSKIKDQKDIFPLLALVVSGGHTELVLMRDHFQYEVLGVTQDDAAGEAFDKVARLLGLPYPGGPIVAQKADAFRALNFQFPISNDQILKSKPRFPRPMINSKDYNFSFSGLKTAVLYYLKKNEGKLSEENFVAEVAYQFQEAVVDVLVAKTKKALGEYAPETLVIAGGVSANVRLREQLEKLIAQHFPKTQFLTPPFQYSLDNAAMIGAAALFRYEHLSPSQKEALLSHPFSLEPNANLPLRSL